MYCDPPGPRQDKRRQTALQVRTHRRVHADSYVQIRTYRLVHTGSYIPLRTYRLVRTGLYLQARTYKLVRTGSYMQTRSSIFSGHRGKTRIHTIWSRGSPLKTGMYCIFVAIATENASVRFCTLLRNFYDHATEKC